jgi:hypothetical protein
LPNAFEEDSALSQLFSESRDPRSHKARNVAH